jgi:selenocysteine lyase/cysteine desulfurase
MKNHNDNTNPANSAKEIKYFILKNLFITPDNVNDDYITFMKENSYNKNIPFDSYLSKIEKNKLSLKILFCDDTATSFPLKIVEERINNFLPYYYTNHSNNFLGIIMNEVLNECRKIITNCFNCTKDNKIIFSGSGTTSCICQLCHIIKPLLNCKDTIFITTLYEHYSNFLSWYHKCDNLYILKVNKDGSLDKNDFNNYVDYALNKNLRIIFSVISASNVVGNINDLDDFCIGVHKTNGYIFIDCATSISYIPIDMNKTSEIYYDAISFSPHKIAGGQSGPGVLIINDRIYDQKNNKFSDCNKNYVCYTKGGGTVDFFSSQNYPVYKDDIEKKENGGTSNILGIIRIALSLQIRHYYMDQITLLAFNMTKIFQSKLLSLQKRYSNLVILNNIDNLYRIPIFAIQIKGLHYNFIVALLSNFFGIISRGGINCTTLLPEYLLNLDSKKTNIAKEKILNNKCCDYYGWVRITVSPLFTDKDIDHIIESIRFICTRGKLYKEHFIYNAKTNLFDIK